MEFNIEEKYRMMLKAKEDVDRWGLVADTIIVPFSWERGITKIKGIRSVYTGSYSFWSLLVCFGAVKEPIAGTYKIEDVKELNKEMTQEYLEKMKISYY